ncbi:hypothetical protein Ctob_004238 [Chrysochromulina tobinii]|uniref:Uncharacterized protein n=1 Tax=Chrysochromulina tobinii TaxID=1460289 RepID=A0A0M0J5Q1_9EUKA|nr:hypothetical protein Ctob_004238 [Chrysochromulina tobinii]|eukprot:KOO21810.1 hypothetical protein Ctob_004238 [Chrysochromulina sp. CCMP291]
MATSAGEDYAIILKGAGVNFELPPPDWREAGNRLRQIITAYQNTKISPGKPDKIAFKDAGSEADPARVKLVRRTSMATAALSCAASIITQLTEPGVVEAEAAAEHSADPIDEARRIVGTSYGDAARALMSSDGSYKDALAGNGSIAAPVLLAQQGLLAFIEAFIERLVTEERAGECTGEIEALSLAILTSSLAGAVKVEGGSKSVDFALIVKLLGSTKPSNNRATKSSKSGAGHWGTTTGPKATSDIETAMMHLGTILLAIRVKALGEDGGTREDYGMHDLARDALGELTVVKATELFEDLFQRADRGARHQRSRANVLETGWASLIEVDMREKLEALGREEHSEEAGARAGKQAAAEALAAGNKHKAPVITAEGDAKADMAKKAGGAPAVPPGTLDKVRAACVASLQAKI